MTTYYVDLANPGAWNGRTGQDTTTNLWLGILGLQKAADVAAPGDITYIQGVGDGSLVYSVPFDNLSGTFTAGEAVTWHDGAGVIYEAASTPCRIELTSGNICTNDDEITGSTSSATLDVNGSATTNYEIGLDTTAGTLADGYVKYVGVNSSWVNDGTLAVIDGGGLGVSTMDGFNVYMSYQWLENIKAYDCNGMGFNLYTAIGSFFLNCHAINCDQGGFDSYIGVTHVLCSAYGNGSSGFATGGSGAKYFFCVARGNGARGFAIGHEYGVCLGCLSYDNTTDGYSLYAASVILNCVADNNTSDGVELTGTTLCFLLGCRLTDNAYGINGASKPLMYGWNYMPEDSEAKDNTSGQLTGESTPTFIALSVAGVATNNLAGTDTNGGYNDPDNDDYNLIAAATLRRTGITLRLETDGLT